MTIELFDLCGQGDVRFSPYCWRTKMSLAHKRLDFETVPVRFTDIPKILDGRHATLPVIQDGGHNIRDSFEIALYLEHRYPDRPSLFGGAGGIALSRFVEAWSSTLHSGIAAAVIKDIHDALQPEDQNYFRQSREQDLGRSLEDHQRGREAMLQQFHKQLLPLSRMLDKQPFTGGSSPLYPDYIVFGSLQWPQVISAFSLLPDKGTLVRDWFDRMAGLYDGLGGNAPCAEGCA